MKRILFGLLILVLFSCHSYQVPELKSVRLKTLDQEGFIFDTGDNKKILVFVFISPECPLCISYTKPIIEMKSKFEGNQVQFYAIFSGTYYSSVQIRDFQKQYNFDIICLQDTGNNFAQLLEVTVTPEVVLLNHAGEKVYSGAIDDWAYAPGKKRQVITKKFLEDAIAKVISNEYPAITKTEPIGCSIEL
ncbi:MAG: redoxin family protein [Bacteroidetes bacterium]|nr:redoxin family protein [Bacteroidota bacterium]